MQRDFFVGTGTSSNQSSGKWSWKRSDFFKRFGQEVFTVQKLPMWKGKLLAEQSSAAGIAAAGGEDDITLAQYLLRQFIGDICA